MPRRLAKSQAQNPQCAQVEEPLKRLYLYLLGILASTLAHSGILPYMRSGMWNDWAQFSSFSLVIRSLILEFGQFPIHSPYVCGGLDLVSNPQTRIFTPFLLADLSLPPLYANVLSVWIYGVTGFVGMYRLLRSFDYNWVLGLFGGFFWLHAGWFGLHFAEGHVAFGSMQTLPLFLALARHPNQRSSYFKILFFWAFMVLDGSLYPAVFSLFCLLTAFSLGLAPWPKPSIILKPRLWVWLLYIPALILFTLPKVYPVGVNLGKRTPEIDFFTMKPQLILKALFHPLTTPQYSPHIYTYYRFHEYGNYLSVLGLIFCIYTMIKRKSDFKFLRKFIVAMLFWFWVGTGIARNFNPWLIYQHLPLVNNVHVNARALLILYLFFALLLVHCLSLWQKRFWPLMLLMSFLMVEAVVVRTFPYSGLNTHQEDFVDYQNINSKNVHKTIKGFHFTPRHLLTEGVASTDCYERSFESRKILGEGEADYRGEIYFIEGEGTAELLERSPATLKVSYDISPGSVLELNVNSLFGWQVDPELATLEGRGVELLRIRPKTQKASISLHYWPPYMNFLIASYICGLLMLMGVYWVEKNSDPSP